VNKFFLKRFLFLCVIIFGFVFLIFTKTEVFFSPNDDIETKLIDKIKLAKKRVYAAIYMLTDKDVAQALVDAKKRGLDVQVITDISCFESRFGKMKLLEENGILVFVFKPNGPKNKYQNELMHNKFALIDNIFCTGSYNWTISANKRNHENIMFVDDENTQQKEEEMSLQKYEKKFEELKKICVCHDVAKEAKTEMDKTTKSKKSDGITYRAYQKLIDKTTEFLKSIREVLTTP
jgi:phosphatidylserine/phosphatidylglycerophosphate/cardiolipin synthase-like enzyme